MVQSLHVVSLTHLRSAHPEAYSQGRQRYRALNLSTLRCGRQCPYCLSTGTDGNIRSHLRGHCVVILQRCMAQSERPLSSDWLSGEHAPTSDSLLPQVPDLATTCEDGLLPLQAHGSPTSRCLGGSNGTTEQACKVRATAPRQTTRPKAPPALSASAKRAPSRVRSSGGEDTKAKTQTEPLVKSLAKLVLQQQEAIQAHTGSCGYMLHLGRDPVYSVVEQLILASKAWKQAMEQQDSTVKEPLRALLLKLVMCLLMGKVAEMNKEGGEKHAKLALNASHQFFEQEWQSSSESLVPTSKGPCRDSGGRSQN